MISYSNLFMLICTLWPSLSGRAGLPRRLPVGPLFQDGEGGDGDHGERQQAPPSERPAAPCRLLLYRQNCPQPGKENKTRQIYVQSVLFLGYPATLLAMPTFIHRFLRYTEYDSLKL